MQKKKAVLGIDIGGTNLKMALLDAGDLQRIVIAKEYPTEKNAEKIKKQLITLIKDFSQEHNMVYDILGIGVATAGRVNFSKGRILFATENLPGWSGQPLKEFLEDRSKLPVIVENDVNAAAWGEYIARGKQHSNMVCITLGTGLGAGIIINHELIRGPCGRAGELGHTIIEVDGRRCNCGNRGCLEMYASQQGIIQTAGEYYTDLLSALKVKNLFDAAKDGDPIAKKVINKTS